MTLKNSMPVAVGKQKLFYHLSSSTCQTTATKINDKNCESKSNDDVVEVGIFTWPSGAKYEGEFARGQRNGKGAQTWQDGSSYKGDFLNDMRHGCGTHQWSSGEVKSRFVKRNTFFFACFYQYLAAIKRVIKQQNIIIFY